MVTDSKANGTSEASGVYAKARALRSGLNFIYELRRRKCASKLLVSQRREGEEGLRDV
jgi:hypothetical protein